jgi:hypothetical protein
MQPAMSGRPAQRRPSAVPSWAEAAWVDQAARRGGRADQAVLGGDRWRQAEPGRGSRAAHRGGRVDRAGGRVMSRQRQ